MNDSDRTDDCDHAEWRLWTQQHCDGREWIHGSCEECGRGVKPAPVHRGYILVPDGRDTDESWRYQSRAGIAPLFGGEPLEIVAPLP